MQGQAIKKKGGDNDNDGLIIVNGAEDVDGNGCCRATADDSNELDCSAEVMEEDKPDDADGADELRPPKKTKCSIDETCSVPLEHGKLVTVNALSILCFVLGYIGLCGLL